MIWSSASNKAGWLLCECLAPRLPSHVVTLSVHLEVASFGDEMQGGLSCIPLDASHLSRGAIELSTTL